MNTAPIEILEQIIAYIPIEDLFSLCHTDRTLFKLIRHEAYKRWKKYELKKADWKEGFSLTIDLREDVNEDEQSTRINLTMENWEKSKEHGDKLLCLMKNMLDNGMIVDNTEKELIENAYFDWQYLDYMADDC